MKKKHLLRSILAIALCILMIGTVIAVGYTIYENVQGKKVVIDKDNNLPVVKPSNGSVSAPVTTENGLTVSDVTLKTNNDGVLAVIPQGTKLNDGVKEVTLTVKEIKDSQANIELAANEEKVSYDIHIEGVANDNAAPIKVYIKEMLPSGLNIGNYKLYHVENGTTTAMTVVNGEATHNSFEYDAVTGDVTLYLASFSEVALVADTENAWEGNFDYSWYTNAVALVESGEVTEYIIANADQLAAFGAIVGGMAEGIERDGFTSKTVKLIADINLGDKNNANESLIFHPIGYYYTDDKNADGTTGDYYSAVYSFEGTFNGNGHTVKNFYQNTWEIKGDYDGNYYSDAMGLFGYVVNGTVKNLTVDNFSSDGEYTPTGVIAAYAVNSTFENIAITNCNPRVYNTGNGGIVGVAGNSDDTDAKSLTFANITVDQTNKISALWGSWDVACGGIMGMFRGNGLVTMTNCHVAAMIDVNNDVCANYQYYWYRYSGMFIGSIRKNTTEGNYTVADTTGITAEGCTYTLGNWNEYWYCELVANSLASYTHDHQFSRLTKIASLKDIQDENGNWNVAGNFVIPNADNSSAECYHIFKNSNGELYQHFHDVADESNLNIYETFDLNGDGLLNDLKEDRTCYYMPFNQILNGNGYGVKAHYAFNGITEVKDGTVLSSEKFEIVNGAPTTYRPGQTIIIGDLFESTVDDTKLSKISIFVAVSSKTENDNVKAVYQLDLSDWKNSKITFDEDCVGSAKIIITDYFYCTPTVIYLDPEPKTAKFDANAIGNQDAYTQITLGALFGVEDGAVIGNVTTTVTDPNGKETTISGTSADWSLNTIDLIKDGNWTVSIKDDDEYCLPTETTFTVNKVDKFTNKFDKDFLYRVGNATNSPVTLGTIFKEIETAVALSSVDVTITNVAGDATGTFTSKTPWTSGSIQFSGTGVVKVTISADGANDVSINLEVIDATNLTSATGTTTGGDFVLLCDVNTTSYIYYYDSSLYGNGFTYSLKGAPTAYNSKQGKGIIITKNAVLDNLVIVGDVYDGYGAYTNNDYYNTAIDVTGDTTIQNCYISGCAAPVRARNNVTIINSTLYGGTVGNLIIESGTVTLENVTTANYDDGRKLVGMGIVIHSDATEAAKLVLNGTLTQYNFMSESKVPTDTYAKNLHNTMFSSSCSNYHFGSSPNRYVNTGIVSLSSNFDGEDIEDNANTGYVGTNITLSDNGGYVYTQLNTSGSVNNNYPEYKPTTQGAVPPSYSFDYTNKNYIAKTDGSNDYCYRENGKVNISMDDGDTFNWDTSILTLGKGITSYTVSMNGVDYTGKSIAFNAAGEYTVSYTYTDDNNCKLDENGNLVTYSVTYTKTVEITVSVVKATTKHAEFTFGSSNTASTIVTVGNSTYVMPNVTGTSSTIGSTTVNGQTIYYPIVEIIMSDGKTSHSSGWYAYFPVFSGAVTITDYANNGTGDKMTPYNGSTTTMPSNLSVVGDAKTLFKYQSGSNAGEEPVVKNNKLVYSSAKIEADRSEYNTFVQYSYTDNAGATYYYYVGYHAPAQSYKTCLTPDTTIMLANGTQVRVDSLTGNENLLVWNHETGKLESASVAYIVNHDKIATEKEIIHLYFSNGSEIKIIGEHVFYDATLNKYIAIDTNNAESYIGHKFLGLGDNAITEVELVSVSRTVEITEAYEIVSYKHLTCFTNGILSTSAYLDKLLNIFDIDTETYAYNAEAVQKDIEAYGLYTYADFEGLISEEAFELYNAKYLKIAVGKGYITWDDILDLIDIYFNVDVQPIQ